MPNNNANANACNKDDIEMYRLTNDTIEIFTAMRHIGFPLYIGSFDFYCFMVSLMTDHSFYAAVMNNKGLYKIWSMMFLTEDLVHIEQDIKHIHEINLTRRQSIEDTVNASHSSAFEITLSILRNTWLRCDIVNFIWHIIKHEK